MNYINNLLKILNKEIKIWKAIEVIDYKSIQKIKNKVDLNKKTYKYFEKMKELIMEVGKYDKR